MGIIKTINIPFFGIVAIKDDKRRIYMPISKIFININNQKRLI